MGYFLLIGISSLRRRSSGALSDTARLTAESRPSRSMPGAIPQVDSVILRVERERP